MELRFRCQRALVGIGLLCLILSLSSMLPRVEALTYSGEFRASVLWMQLIFKYSVNIAQTGPRTLLATVTGTVYGNQMFPVKIVSATSEAKDSGGRTVATARLIGDKEIWVVDGQEVRDVKVEGQALIGWDEYRAYPSSEVFTAKSTVQCQIWGWFPYTYSRTDSLTKAQLTGG